ncbi:MAG: hypothetical protein RIE53_02045 [Rhodothermales bacterium]
MSVDTAGFSLSGIRIVFLPVIEDSAEQQSEHDTQRDIVKNDAHKQANNQSRSKAFSFRNHVIKW